LQAAQQLVTLHEAYGDAFLVAVKARAQPALPGTAMLEDGWMGLMADIASHDVKRVKDTLRKVLREQAGPQKARLRTAAPTEAGV
jgi:hypothetical protein